MNEEKKTPKILKRVLLIIGIIIPIILSFLVIFVIKDLQQEEILKKEIVNYSNKELATDNFQIEIKTKGDYAHVERTIKKYYKELSDNVKEINSYLTKDEFTKILSAENLTTDHPDFILSRSTVKDMKEKMQTLLANIEKLCDEKVIKEFIDKEKLKDQEYYYDLYLELMYTKKDLKELQKVKEKMQTLSATLNEFLDKVDEMLIYLQANDNQVEYKNNQVLFKSESSLAGYKKLLTELQVIANKFTTIDSNKSPAGSQI